MNLPEKQKKIAAALAEIERLINDASITEAEEAKTLLDQVKVEVRKAERAQYGLLLALAADELVPIRFFKAFASYPRFQHWQKAKMIRLEMRNGKVCVKPSEFFKLWARLDPQRPLQFQQ